jgi:DNA-binding response OmpR family regulator
VLILSSSDAAKDRLETAKLGATRYIRKPSRLDEFLQLGSVFKEMLDRPLPH